MTDARAMPPRFSVVITSYNRRALLEEALDSVVAQSFQDWEVIVVDDGSTDGSLELARERAAREPRIRAVVSLENGGRPGRTRNAGLLHATGTILTFLDGDDRWHPDRLAHVAAAFDEFPDADLVFSDFRIVGTPEHDAIDGGYLAYRGAASAIRALATRVGASGAHRLGEAFAEYYLVGFPAIFPLNTSVRRATVDRHALRWDESLQVAEDFDFFMQIVLVGPSVFVPAVLGDYRVVPGSMSRAKSHAKLLMNADVLARNVDRFQACCHDRATPALRRRVRAALRDAYFEVGYAYWRDGDLASARRHLTRALRFAPSLKGAAAIAKTLLPATVVARVRGAAATAAPPR